MTVRELVALLRKDIEAWKGAPATNRDLVLSVFNYKLFIVWLYRWSHFWYRRRHFGLARFTAGLNLFWFGIEIGTHVVIGGGFRIHHPTGVVLGARSIGENFNVFAGAGCGGVAPDNRAQPIIGNSVYLYAGAKIFGDVTIGDNVIIGANAVVLKSVPSNSVAVGVPARTLPKRASGSA